MPAQIQSQEHYHIPATKFTPLNMKADQVSMDSVEELKKIGINLDGLFTQDSIDRLARAGVFTGDALQPTITTPSETTLVQFLQSWLPGNVNVITQARNIDMLIGMTNVADWEDEEVVQTLLELTGEAAPYGDYTDTPLSSWNVNFEARTIIRFEEGLQVGRLEERRAAKQRQDTAGNKRAAAALVLEIRRNAIGFFGFNNGVNRTYGFLNDPGLTAYVPVPPNLASDTTWADKDYLDIVTDILTATSDLRTQSGDTINPFQMPCTLAVASDAVSWLAKSTNFGYSVQKWIDDTFKGNLRVVSAPELNGAHNSDNVFYLYADSVSGDGSTDGGRTWIQPVPTKFLSLGVQAKVKGFEESYSNATAGAMCKRPYAVVRFYGI